MISIKKLICSDETYKHYNIAITKAGSDGLPHNTDTVVNTLRGVIMNCVPWCARLSKMLQRSIKKNQMGSRGENVMRFTQELLFEIKQSGWASMTQDEAGVLFWLQDLCTLNKHQMELSKKGNNAWDTYVTKGKTFTVQNCMSLAL